MNDGTALHDKLAMYVSTYDDAKWDDAASEVDDPVEVAARRREARLIRIF